MEYCKGSDRATGLLPAFILTCLLPLMIPSNLLASEAGTDPLSQLDLPAVEPEPWRFTGFPITGWWTPPGTASLEDFIAYGEAGFTLHLLNPDVEFWKALDYVEKAGSHALAFRTFAKFGPDPAEIDFAEAAKRDSIVGWVTHDEPAGYAALTEAITAVNTLMREDPTRRTFFNFLPPQAQKNPSTVPVIDAAVKHGMQILSYDHYVVYEDGNADEQGHFDNLELFRQASLRHDLPFWAFALTIQHWHYRRPSESDVRWKQFTNLAYGAKGLWYFTYWGPSDWEKWDTVAIVDPVDGSKTDLYEVVRAINHTVLDIGDLLLRLQNQDVVHTNPPEGHRPFEKDKFWISGIDAEDAVIGFFKDPVEGDRYAMIVNGKHGKGLTAADTAQTMTLHFAPEVESVTAVSWLDGKTGPLKLRERSARLEIAGGTGILLRLDAPSAPR